MSELLIIGGGLHVDAGRRGGRPQMVFDRAVSPAVLRPGAAAQVPQNVR